jgi:hypothetical protein
MAVHYVPFAKVRVSGRWNTVLRRARKAGIRFRVNSGHRTMRQQWRLFRQNMRWAVWRWVPRPGRPLTAYPSPLAPHIRSGRAAHALDVDEHYGDGALGLAHWLRKHGAHPTFPVPGERWHLELSRQDLRMLWKKFR